MSASKTTKDDDRLRARKGRSGVRRSRNSRSEGLVATIERLLAERMTKADGSRSDFTFLEAIVFQLISKSAAGDKRARKVLMRYRLRDPEFKEPEVTVIGGLPD